MVGVAQFVEPRIVIPDVVGSSPIIHPILIKHLQQCKCFFLSVILTKLLIKFDLELINFKYVPLYSYIKDKMKLLRA